MDWWREKPAFNNLAFQFGQVCRNFHPNVAVSGGYFKFTRCGEKVPWWHLLLWIKRHTCADLLYLGSPGYTTIYLILYHLDRLTQAKSLQKVW